MALYLSSRWSESEVPAWSEVDVVWRSKRKIEKGGKKKKAGSHATSKLSSPQNIPYSRSPTKVRNPTIEWYSPDVTQFGLLRSPLFCDRTNTLKGAFSEIRSLRRCSIQMCSGKERFNSWKCVQQILQRIASKEAASSQAEKGRGSENHPRSLLRGFLFSLRLSSSTWASTYGYIRNCGSRRE